jgi:hypothetical protein
MIPNLPLEPDISLPALNVSCNFRVIKANLLFDISPKLFYQRYHFCRLLLGDQSCSYGIYQVFL